MKDDVALNQAQAMCIGILHYYRGMTAIQLAKIIYETENFTQSNEKYIYGQLSKLEQAGLVTRYKPLKSVSKYAIYFLTKKGFELINNLYELTEGYIGTGWVGEEKEEGEDLGHFTYDIYKPPMRQIQHHLATIDAQISATLAEVPHRNNLYASRSIYNGAVLRMDAELKINGEHYAIEIDRNTESHQQLVAKFDNYLYYCLEQTSKGRNVDIQHIVFVIPFASEHDGRLKRRWQNILAAYYKGLKGWTNQIELHMVLQNDLSAFINGQKNEQRFLKEIQGSSERAYRMFATDMRIEKEVCFLQGFSLIKNRDVQIVVAIINSRYSSRNVKSCVRLTRDEDVLYYLTGLPCIDVDLSLYNVDPIILKAYNTASNLISVPRKIKLTR